MVPRNNVLLKLRCNMDSSLNITEPTFIKIASNCKITIHQQTFEFNNMKTESSKSLILPPKEIPRSLRMDEITKSL